MKPADNNRKRILLLAGNFSPELTGIGKYNGEMIEWLADNGYECTVITTYPYYPQWKVQEAYKTKRYWFSREIKSAKTPITVIRCPHYVPGNPSGFKRLLSEITILISTSFALAPFFFKRRFDFIMSVAPPFETGVLGVLYRKLKRATFLYHIQDLQIDAAKELKMVKSSFLLNTLFSVEKFILRNADVVSTISTGMMNKVVAKCSKDVVFFPNWVDTDNYYPIEDKLLLKTQFGFNSTDKIVLYSGAIGEKQGLEAIIHAAKSLSSIINLKFIICGSGPYKESLIALKESLGVDNIHFLPLQPSETFNQFLNMADVHLILQKANASDLVLPSKLTTVLAIGGVAIVSANPGTSLYQIMTATNMGYVIEPENQKMLEQAIVEAVTDGKVEKGLNARKYAENNLSQAAILKKFSERVLAERPKDNYEKVIALNKV